MSYTINVRAFMAIFLASAALVGVRPHGVQAQAGPSGELVVTVVGLENDDGTVLLAVFDHPEGFTDEPSLSEVATASGRVARWTVRVPYGRYAVAAIHDADGDGRLDTNFLGMPRERYGFSNDARGTFGPPSFEDASFRVDRPTVTLTVEVR